jgi:hypothetical protein
MMKNPLVITFNASIARILNRTGVNDFERVLDEEIHRFAALADIDKWGAEHHA